jgi:hypothetical protein
MEEARVIKRIKDKDEPKGGWLGPPNAKGVPALAVQQGKKFKPVALSAKEKKKRRKFFDAMAKADKKKKWSFKWK